MPPHDAAIRDSDAQSRLRQFVEKTDRIDNGKDRPGLVRGRRSTAAQLTPVYEENDDDGPITTRWAVG